MVSKTDSLSSSQSPLDLDEADLAVIEEQLLLEKETDEAELDRGSDYSGKTSSEDEGEDDDSEDDEEE